MLFTAKNPKEDLINLIKAKNPAVKLPTEAFNVLSVTASADGLNTVAQLSVNAEYGMQGRFTVRFDRTDLSELYNKFPSGARMPLFRMFGDPGTIITFSNIIDQVNQFLGTSFTISGQLQDLVDKQFTLPSKNASITVEILASDKSVRLLPGTKLSILVVANGAILSSAIVNRSLNPIVNAAGVIPFNGVNIDPANPKEYPGFRLMYLDFTAINIQLGGMLTAVVTSNAMDWSYVYYTVNLKPEAFDLINAKLASVGLSPLKSRRVSGEILSYDKNPNNAIAKVPKSVNDPSLANVSVINRNNFTHVIPIPVNYGGQTEGPTSYAATYYLHYNAAI